MTNDEFLQSLGFIFIAVHGVAMSLMGRYSTCILKLIILISHFGYRLLPPGFVFEIPWNSAHRQENPGYPRAKKHFKQFIVI